MEEDSWLKVADAARYVGFSPSTLIKWADAGDVSCIKTKSGHRRFLRSDLNAFIEEHRVKGRQQQAENQRMGPAGASA